MVAASPRAEGTNAVDDRAQGGGELRRHPPRTRYLTREGAAEAPDIALDTFFRRRVAALGLEGVARTLGRSRAKELALDVHEADAAMRDAPDAELAERAGEVDELLRDFPGAAPAAGPTTARVLGEYGWSADPRTVEGA